MTRRLITVAGLTAVYLLVLTSLHPGDVALGALLAGAAVVGLRHHPASATHARRVAPRAFFGAVGATAVEMVRGSWRTARFCLGAPAAPGFVELPREGRSRYEVALWGVLTGEAPDEIPVDVDEERDVLIVHLIDASDPYGVRARHHAAHARARREAGR